MTITKDMLLYEILSTEKADAIATILESEGMHCVGWPSAQMESLEAACMGHGIDVNKVVAKINEAIK